MNTIRPIKFFCDGCGIGFRANSTDASRRPEDGRKFCYCAKCAAARSAHLATNPKPADR